MDAPVARVAAVQTAAFVESLSIGGPLRNSPKGGWLKSTDVDERTDPSLYHGTAGIIIFLLELSRLTGVESQTARRATELRAESYRDRAVAEGLLLADHLRAKQWSSVAFATGWPGYAFTMQTLWEATGDETFKGVAVRCLEQLVSQSSPLGAGMGWIEPMPFSDITGKTGDREIYDLSVGAGGAALMFLHAHRGGLDNRALGWAVLTGDRLLEVGETTPDGTKWGLMGDMPFPFTAPNFAHGGAGVGYFFAQLFDATGDQHYLEAAISAADYVVSRMCSVGEHSAMLVCHTEEQAPPMFYLGECHGPAGTWRLLATLGRITGDTKWLSYARILLDGVLAIGAPERRSDGWWKNHSQCCGDSGLGDSALAMWASTGDSGYVDLAHRCAEVVVAQSTVDDSKRSWVQAEHRARPKFLQTQTGYMQGAAGIGSFLSHLAAPASRIWFPDERL